jgi:L-malate glycosyltransferase
MHSGLIKILITTRNLDMGGVEQVVLTYVQFLRMSGYDVAVAYRLHGATAEEISRIPGVRTFCYEEKTKWRRLSKLLKFARSVRPDIVHNHFNWVGLIVGWLLKVPRVETIHNTYHFLTPAEKRAFTALSLLASRLIAVSDQVRHFTFSYFPLLRVKRIDVIHNGIDVRRFSNLEASDELRRPFNITAGDTVIGFCGRLEEQKGLIYLLQALRQLNASFDHVRCFLVGEGTLRARLEDDATRLGLHNLFLLGYQSDTRRFYGLFDIFVLPSLFEGLPVSLMEAMAAGCAIVATRVGGVPELVTHGETGLLVDPGDVPQLTRALRELISDPQRRKTLGAAGRDHVRKEFSAEVMVGKTEKVYRELLGN